METKKKSLLRRLWDYFIENMWLPAEEEDNYEDRMISKAEKIKITLWIVFSIISGIAFYGLLLLFLIKF